MSAFGGKADIAPASQNVLKMALSAIVRKRTLVSALFGNLGAANLILGRSGSPSTSNKIIQKRLASSRGRSGTVPSSGRWLRLGILPRRLLRRGGASVVAAMVAAQPKEIPMTKAKSKRRPASRTNDSTTRTRSSVERMTARKVGQLKSVTEPASNQRPRAASQPTAGNESKKAHIIAMLRAPGGATIEAMARAAKWQPHSVRGFLAGIVRKKLGLNLISVAGDRGRVYRIADRTAPAAA